MGGKTWTKEEERVYWEEIIRYSPKGVGIDRMAMHQKTWAELVPMMRRLMGKASKREYTALMLFEHWFQNAVSRRFSPHATVFVNKYLQRAAESGHPIEPIANRRRGPYRPRKPKIKTVAAKRKQPSGHNLVRGQPDRDQPVRS